MTLFCLHLHINHARIYSENEISQRIHMSHNMIIFIFLLENAIYIYIKSSKFLMSKYTTLYKK